MQAVVSVDGFIAYPDDTVGPLLDWYGNGDVTVHVNDKWPFKALADELVAPAYDVLSADELRVRALGAPARRRSWRTGNRRWPAGPAPSCQAPPCHGPILGL
jgi:hypothetical protein